MVKKVYLEKIEKEKANWTHESIPTASDLISNY